MSASAREAALQMLYALEVGGQDAAQIERWYVAAHPLAPAVRERAGALVDAAVQRRARIEELIGTHSHGWKLERISLIDRALLKLACAELLLEPEPAWPEAIQTAAQLAKRYSQPEAQRFVRGLLEAIATALRGGPAA
jgi:N utilization substance protein B